MKEIEKLKDSNCYIKFDTQEKFDDFLGEMKADDRWLLEKLFRLQLTAIKAGETPVYDLVNATTDQVNQLYADGGLTLTVHGDKYILNNLALFTLNDRTGLRSDYIGRLLKNEMYHEYVEHSNMAFTSKVYVENEVQALVRGGMIVAVHTGKYNKLEQEDVFNVAKAAMLNRFSGYEFQYAKFTHPETSVSYSLCTHKDKILESYAEAWKDAGFPENMLEKSFPMITVSTSDLGLTTFNVKPEMKIGSSIYPLGEKMEMKHNGKANIAEIPAMIDSCFAKLQEGLKNLENLLKVEVRYGSTVFIKACEKIGLVKNCKKAVRRALQDFKDTYPDGTSVNAFDIYTEIIEIQYSSDFEAMNGATKLKCVEAFSRLLEVDWQYLDKPGVTDI